MASDVLYATATMDLALLRHAERRLRALLPRGMHVGRGQHYRRGLRTGWFGLVVYVRVKQPRGQVPVAQRVPRFIELRHAGRLHRVPVDVKPIPLADKQASIRPGRSVQVGPTTVHGTLSGAVATGGGYSALLSGHVAGAVGTPIVAAELDGAEVVLGVVDAVRDDRTMDAAVVRDIPIAELSLLTIAPAAVRSASSLMDEAVSVAGTTGVRNATIDDVYATVTFETGGEMTGLISLHPRMTQAGDSGAPVSDSNGRIVGFVVGANASHSFVIPAEEVLRAMLDL